MAGTYLLRTPSSTTNRKTCTLSVWIKRGAVGARQAIASQTVDGSNETFIWFDTNDELFLKESGEATYEFRTNRKFRDTSAWYHIVMAIDTTQSSGGNRVKLYVNGIQETSVASATDPALNVNTRWNSTTPFNIGRMSYNSEYFNGSMSHFHWIDGTAYDASAFGSTDSTTGEWKINTSPSVTYGTNGFFILKDSGSKTDQSGNGNNFSEEGTPGIVSNTQDSPSNVFATLNALAKPGAGNLPSFGNGNTHYNKTATGAGNNSMIVATLGATTGKFYYEYKMNDSNAFIAGISTLDNTYYDANGGSMNTASGVGVAYQSSGNKIINGTSTSYGNSYGSGNIVGVAFDLVNNVIYFSKDGVWQNSGDPTSGSSGTGGIGIATTGITYSPFAQNNGYNSPSSVYYNFGNGYFGTTAVSSAGTNASGIGIFEYDVPTGYTALSTKGLNL